MKRYRNQILVTDKIFITPEFKKKKKAYKWNFILSIFLIVFLFSYYVYAEYDRNKSEEVSKTLLSEMNFEDEEEVDVSKTIKTEDNVIIVILDQNEDEADSENINIDSVQVQEDSTVTANDGSTMVVYNANSSNTDFNTTYTAKDGTKYSTVAMIDIPKINVHYPVIAPVNRDLKDYTAILKISPCRYYGPEPNEVGNYCIVGHNYRNKKFFSKAPTLENGDIVQLTDSTGRMMNYRVYDKYTVDPSNQDCTDQRTNGRREVTLITCTNDSKQRWIIKCVEESQYVG